MPPAVGALAAIGGGSALAGGAIAGAGALGLYGAKRDRDAADTAQQRADRARQQSQDYIEKNIKQARQDIFKLFPQAQQSRRAGVEAGLDLFSDALPAQLGAFQQGNMGAQRAISQGLPQFQNAILGQPVNQQAFQPQQVNIPGIEALMNRQMPNLPQIQNPTAQPQAQTFSPRPWNYDMYEDPINGISGMRR